ncbi:MAG TPA: YfiR family protein [Telluria sp.]|nr:YfiR family protein [Telluria sp.]
MRPRAALAFLPLAFAVAMGAGPARAEPVPERDLKAAYIFNFAVFTDWPADVLPPAAPIVLCVRQRAALYPVLAQLADKSVNGHRITIRTAPATPRECHLVYLDRDDRERWGQLKRELAGSAVLTVSDDQAISGDGAVIGMALENRHISFDVDLNAARSARLNLSSKLLRLARSVQ